MDKYADQKEMDLIATEYINLRNKIKNNSNKILLKEFKEYQNFCITKCKSLVLSKVGKYQKFSNYKDLEQDGFEALILALKTYDPSKGSFSWWANKYIHTRVSRSANTHSTIRFPLKKAKEIKPFKVSTIPILIDVQPNPAEHLEITQQSLYIKSAIKELPETHQKLINVIYGFHGSKPHSINKAIKLLNIPRSECFQILEEAKIKIKNKLINMEL